MEYLLTLIMEEDLMKSMFVKGGIALALAVAFGVNAQVVDAASIVPDNQQLRSLMLTIQVL